MYQIKAIVRPNLVEGAIQALQAIADMPSVAVSTVRAHDRRKRSGSMEMAFDDVAMAKLETVVPDQLLKAVVEAIKRHAHTGRDGDGDITVAVVEYIVRIQTGDFNGNHQG